MAKRSQTRPRKRAGKTAPGKSRRGASAGAVHSSLRASPRAAVEHHLFTLFSSLGRMAGAPISTLMTMGVIAIALALPAAFYITLRTAGEISVGWSSVGEVSIFLQAETKQDDAEGLLAELEQRSDVADVRLISPATALAEFERNSDLGEAVAALDENPLPWVVVIQPADESAETARTIATDLEARALVDFAQIDMEWLDRFDAMIGVGRRAVLLIGSLLALGVLLIVGNTIRLDIENRREEIEVSKMLGGSHGFVRRPFLYSGFWYGLGGGLLALVLVSVGLSLLGDAVDSLIAAYGSAYQFAGLGWGNAFRLLLAAGLIGWAGSWLAVSRHLAKINPR